MRMNIQRGAFSCNHLRAGTVVRRQTVHVADESLPFPGSCRGRLLVATPPLDDPNFDRTVIYVLQHDADGAVGVVVLPGPATGALLPGVWPAGGAPGVGWAAGG